MRSGLICFCMLFALLFSTGLAHAGVGDMNLEAQLIWGTNDTKTDAKLKPADPALVKKLQASPFKWDHYFEMHREQFVLKLNQEKSIPMSRNCIISVTNLKDNQIQLRLFGKGVLANTVSQSLPKGQVLITGGNAENSTAWFIVLRQTD